MAPSPSLYSRALGRHMTERLKRWLLPRLAWNQQTYGDVLRGYVSPRVRWLDAGCGRRLLGADLEKLEDGLRNAARQLVGVDVERRSLSKHRNLFDRVCAGLDALPFRDRSFDLVTCNLVTEHLADPRAAFAELTRVLKPGGVLIVHTANVRNYAVVVERLVERALPDRVRLEMGRLSKERGIRDRFPAFYRANSLGKLQSLFTEFGLQMEQARMLAAPQPMFLGFAPLALLELLVMRATSGERLRDFGAGILIVGRLRRVPSVLEKVAA